MDDKIICYKCRNWWQSRDLTSEGCRQQNEGHGINSMYIEARMNGEKMFCKLLEKI